jgi:hypothetical protein
MKVRVLDPYQVGDNNKVYTSADEPFEANDTDARNWIRLGYAQAVGGEEPGPPTLDSAEAHRSVEDHELAVEAEARTENAEETRAKAAQLLAEAETTEFVPPEVKSPIDSPDEHKSLLDHEMAVEADSKAEYASETQEKLPDTLAAALKATEEQEAASLNPVDSAEHHKSPSDHEMAVQAEEAREPVEETRAKTAAVIDRGQKAAERAAAKAARGSAKTERAEDRAEDKAAKAAEREADKAAREAAKAEDKAVKVEDQAAAKDAEAKAEEEKAEEEKAKAARVKAQQTSLNKAQPPAPNK